MPNTKNGAPAPKSNLNSNPASKPVRKKKTNKAANPLLIWFFIPVLCLGMIINLVWPERAYSSVENRPLAHIPSITSNGVSTGSWMKDVTTWFSDQLVGRNMFFHTNYLIQKAAGDKEIDDVFLGSRSLIGQPKKPDDAVWNKNLQGITLLANNAELPSTIMIVPGSAQVQPNKLPANAPVNLQEKLFEALPGMEDIYVTPVDVRGILQGHQGEYIYYNTDHHWTSLGAGFAAEEFFAGREEEMSLQDFNSYQVSSSFQGTYASKTGSVGLSDDIFIYTAKADPLYTVKAGDSLTTTIYDKSALERKDQYELFLGRNQALVQIETTSTELGKHLLLFKDSYANAFVQFLLPYYRTITIVDPRYFYDDIDLILSSYSISEVLYLFSSDNFATDASLSNVLDTYENGLYPAEEEQDGDSSESADESLKEQEESELVTP